MLQRCINKGNTIHFNGHTDVVETGNDWSVDPFEGKYIDGLIYGRGACDMKGGIAASIIAVECLLLLVLIIQEELNLFTAVMKKQVVWRSGFSCK